MPGFLLADRRVPRFGGLAIALALLAGGALAACTEAADPGAEGSATGQPATGQPSPEGPGDRLVEASVELTIGLDDGDPRYLFGSVHGIAVDPEGRILVADAQGVRVRVYDDDGRHLFDFGRSGDGPGEFDYPCCLAFDEHGHLWLWNDSYRPERGRYEVFQLTSERAVHQRRIPHPGRGQLWPKWRVFFDGEGGIVHPTFETLRDPTGRSPIGSRYLRLHLDSAGVELRRVALPSVPRDSLGGIPPAPSPGMVTIERRGALVTTQLRAHSPRGGFAEGTNLHYEVNWYDNAGQPVRVTRREVEAPPLSAEERAEAEEVRSRTLEALRARGEPLIDLPIPERHHPLERIFFDQTGRLWVQLRRGADDPFEVADVYDPEGGYLQTARWPANTLLYHGAVRGDYVYGLSLDELGVARILKLHVPWP
jgi:hypothetical protein